MMRYKIDVYSSAITFTEDEVRDKTVVVIDVLRTSSTIQTALENGAKGVIPVSEKEDVSKYTRLMDPSGFLLCGEKDGKKAEGFHLGNSPLEYDPEIIKDKTLIFKTTNGTRAITRSAHAKEIIIGSFLNMSAIVDYLASGKSNNIMLICCGWKSRLSLEDMLCAGAIAYNLFEKHLPDDAMDGAKVAFGLFEKFGKQIAQLVSTTNHARRLRDIGYDKDISYCCKVDSFISIPTMNDGLITIR